MQAALRFRHNAQSVFVSEQKLPDRSRTTLIIAKAMATAGPCAAN
jgi:hypothetical protein